MDEYRIAHVKKQGIRGEKLKFEFKSCGDIQIKIIDQPFTFWSSSGQTRPLYFIASNGIVFKSSSHFQVGHEGKNTTIWLHGSQWELDTNFQTLCDIKEFEKMKSKLEAAVDEFNAKYAMEIQVFIPEAFN